MLEHCKTMCLGGVLHRQKMVRSGLTGGPTATRSHGEQELVKDLTEYKHYEDAAIEVMHDLAVAIVNALDGKTYLKPAFR